MLRSPLLQAGLAALMLTGAIATGCGSTTESPGGGNGDDSGPGAQPPAPSENAVDGDGSGYVFGIQKLYLGDTDRSGSPSPSAWKEFGYNLDNKISSKTSTGLCKPASGAAPSAVYPDGKEGRDNAFGKVLLPLITGLAADAGQQINENIADGSFTIMMKLDTVGTGADYKNIPAALYIGANYADANDGAKPKFDGSDEWPIVRELLDDPNDVNSSKLKFSGSYVSDNTWVSGSATSIDLSLSVAGFSLKLAISRAIVSMEMDAARSSATNGTIAGVLETEALIGELRKVAGSLDAGLCTGNTFESLADAIRQASDMPATGDHDPSKECNAISIGLGFDASAMKLGAVAEAAPPAPDPCEMGSGGNTGTGGNAGTGGGNAGTGGGNAGTGGAGGQ